MRFLKLILWGLFIATAVANAQSDFRHGYIINNAGDTVVGKIDYRGDLLMCSVCTFKNNNKVVKQYSPIDIKAFRFLDSKYYVSREVGEKIVFLEYLIKGEVNIYYLRDDAGDHYYIDKDSSRLTEIPYKEEIKTIDHKLMLSKSKNHVGLLSYYMQDAPELQARIERLKKPEHQNLIKIANEYHNAICTDHECLIFERKIPLFKVSLELFTGTTSIKNATSTNYGGYLYIWVPRSSEKIFFKTGLTRLEIYGDGRRIGGYKIPLHFQYIYRAHRVQPWASTGYSILRYQPYNSNYVGHLLGFDVGVNCRIMGNLNLTTAFNQDFSTISGSLLQNDSAFKRLSYSFDVGLRYDF